jgi:hypothetical protein
VSEHRPIGSVQPEMGSPFWVTVSALVLSALILLLIKFAVLIQ